MTSQTTPMREDLAALAQQHRIGNQDNIVFPKPGAPSTWLTTGTGLEPAQAAAAIYDTTSVAQAVVNHLRTRKNSTTSTPIFELRSEKLRKPKRHLALIAVREDGTGRWWAPEEIDTAVKEFHLRQWDEPIAKLTGRSQDDHGLKRIDLRWTNYHPPSGIETGHVGVSSTSRRQAPTTRV